MEIRGVYRILVSTYTPLALPILWKPHSRPNRQSNRCGPFVERRRNSGLFDPSTIGMHSVYEAICLRPHSTQQIRKREHLRDDKTPQSIRKSSPPRHKQHSSYDSLHPRRVVPIPVVVQPRILILDLRTPRRGIDGIHGARLRSDPCPRRIRAPGSLPHSTRPPDSILHTASGSWRWAPSSRWPRC
jgi:hypothetical protein